MTYSDTSITFGGVSVLVAQINIGMTRSDLNCNFGSEAVLSSPNTDLVCLCPGVSKNPQFLPDADETYEEKMRKPSLTHSLFTIPERKTSWN